VIGDYLPGTLSFLAIFIRSFSAPSFLAFNLQHRALVFVYGSKPLHQHLFFFSCPFFIY
jgi:hypothetical protein